MYALYAVNVLTQSSLLRRAPIHVVAVIHMYNTLHRGRPADASASSGAQRYPTTLMPFKNTMNMDLPTRNTVIYRADNKHCCAVIFANSSAVTDGC